MFKEILLFEIKYRLKQRQFYIFTIVMFLVTALDIVRIPSGQYGNINMNSPFAIMTFMLGMSIMGVFVTTAIMANAIIRDNELNTHSIFYTKPISKFDYLIGRFTGSIIISFLIFWGTALGIMVASIMPWQDPTRIGPFHLYPYLFSLFALVLLNVYIFGAIFYSLATLTRNIFYTYVGVVILFSAFLLFGISEIVLVNLEQETLKALLDPFGLRAFNSMTQYWTPAERNTMLVPMEGILLQNRLLWCSIASLILLLTYLKFQFSEIVSKKKIKRKREGESDVLDTSVGIIEWNIPAATQNFSKELNLRQFLNQAKVETLDIIKSIPFIIIFFIGILLAIINTSYDLSESLYGTSLYPVTYLVVNSIGNMLICFIIIIIYSGELVWKERSKRINEIYDVLPMANWVPFVSKLTALIIITLIILTCAIITGIGIQIYHGYYNFELLQYIKSLFFLVLIPSVLASVLGMFIQTIVNNKFIGYMFMVIFYVGLGNLHGMGFDHNLYLYYVESSMTYSDMNGYGHFVTPEVWFSGYRLFFAVILSVISILFWIRGSETQLKLRLKLAKRRFNKPLKGIAGFASIAFLLTGSFIFYNTNIINEYKTNNEKDAEKVAYEKKYKKYEGIPQPKITEVMANVDIYPDERNVDLRGTYVLVNKTTKTIDSIHIFLNNDLNINSLDIPESKLVLEDKKVIVGYYIYELNKPLQPADSITLSYDLSYITRGFSNDNSSTTVLYNGTALSNMIYFPHIGYNENFELGDKNKRRKYGLPPVKGTASVTDSLARMNSFFSDADWINFETIVSTTPEQIAIAPGTLQREWIENGRRFFHYKVNVPIINLFHYLSADYTIEKDSWKDIDIEIYYHKTHTYNIDRMINAIKNSLEYFTTNFSPYQHKQILIVEFPHHLGEGAVSLANMIPYSEAIGFISKYKGGDDIDLIYYVTAHELAHQWWAHQVIGANVQGCIVLTETLAQYSALMVMEKENGREAMKKFLKYQLDRYLKGRGRARLKEPPLIFTEGQTYITYNKGSLVMYALRDYIGEETLNNALSKFVKDFAFQGPPYPTSLDLLSYIKEATPDSLYYVIEDMFETITLYDNKAKESTYSITEDGKYLVNLTIEAKKLRVDSLGVENEIPINDWIYIGVLGEKEDVNGTMVNKELYIAKHKIDKPVMKIEIIVDELPQKAGIDPYCMLIDRNWDNNLIKVEKKEP